MDGAILDRLDPDATRWFRFPGGCYGGTALHELAPAETRNGSIVVLHMHGGDTAPLTDEAPSIVKGLRDRGFELVTVTKLLG